MGDPMAIFKATYTKKTGAAKGNIRYIENRPGKEDARSHRTLFGIDGKMEREEAYAMIDDSKPGSYFYRFILNFDAEREDTHKDLSLREIAEQTMRGAEELLGRELQWVGVVHADYTDLRGVVHEDHTDLRHVHMLAILHRKLQRQDLYTLREKTTEAAGAQRQARDQALEQQQGRQTPQKGAAWGLQR